MAAHGGRGGQKRDVIKGTWEDVTKPARHIKTHPLDPLCVWTSVFHSHLSPICYFHHSSCSTPSSPTLFTYRLSSLSYIPAWERPPMPKMEANQWRRRGTVANHDTRKKKINKRPPRCPGFTTWDRKSELSSPFTTDYKGNTPPTHT